MFWYSRVLLWPNLAWACTNDVQLVAPSKKKQPFYNNQMILCWYVNKVCHKCLAWISGEAACTLDGHWVSELQRVHNQERCVSIQCQPICLTNNQTITIIAIDGNANLYWNFNASNWKRKGKKLLEHVEWQGRLLTRPTNHSSVEMITVCCVSDKHYQEVFGTPKQTGWYVALSTRIYVYTAENMLEGQLTEEVWGLAVGSERDVNINKRNKA